MRRDLLYGTSPPASMLAGGLLFMLLASAAASGTTQETAGAKPGEQPGREAATRVHPRAQSYLKRQWGVEVEFVRQTSAGYMLEFRYRVLDSDKAKPLFERQTKPILTHEESGAKLVVPTPAKTGALRNSNLPVEGRTYWMFFANPGKLVDVGDVVEIAIGDFVAPGLIVE